MASEGQHFTEVWESGKDADAALNRMDRREIGVRALGSSQRLGMQSDGDIE